MHLEGVLGRGGRGVARGLERGDLDAPVRQLAPQHESAGLARQLGPGVRDGARQLVGVDDEPARGGARVGGRAVDGGCEGAEDRGHGSPVSPPRRRAPSNVVPIVPVADPVRSVARARRPTGPGDTGLEPGGRVPTLGGGPWLRDPPCATSLAPPRNRPPPPRALDLAMHTDRRPAPRRPLAPCEAPSEAPSAAVAADSTNGPLAAPRGAHPRTSHSGLAAAAGAALALLLGTGAAFDAAWLEELVFGPADGARAQKTFDVTTTLDLDAATLEVDGEYEEVSIEIGSRTNTQLLVADTYVQSAQGRPLVLERSFETLAGEASATSRTEILGGGAIQVEHTSPLAGRRVRFERAPGSETPAASFADRTEPPSEAERALLDGLVEDLDLRAWLPGAAVSPGDGWEVDPAALLHVLAPGGDLALAPTDPDQAERLAARGGASGLVELLGTPTGTIQGRLAELRGPAGARQAVLEYEIDVRFAAELTGEDWPAFVDPHPPGEEAVEVDLERTLLDGLTNLGTATLVWDLAARRFAGFELDLSIDLAAEQELVLRLGEEAPLPVRMELSWTLTHRVEAEAR